MVLDRISFTLISCLTLASLTTTGCQPLDCSPVSVSVAEGEAEAGYSAAEIAVLVDKDHAVSAKHTASGEAHEGSLMLAVTNTDWQRWVPEDESVESCPDTQALLEADFALTLGDVDIAGTIAGKSLGPELMLFTITVSEALLMGGLDVSDEGVDSDGVQIDFTVRPDETTVSIVALDETSNSYEPVYE